MAREKSSRRILALVVVSEGRREYTFHLSGCRLRLGLKELFESRHKTEVLGMLSHLVGLGGHPNRHLEILEKRDLVYVRLDIAMSYRNSSHVDSGR